MNETQSLTQLIEQLSAYNYSDRYRAAESLGSLGESASEAIPALMTILGNKKEEIEMRTKAAFALVSIGKNSQEVKALLLRIISDPDDRILVSYACAEYLGALGVTALPSLLEILDHPEWLVRQGAATGISALGKDAAEAVPHLIKAMNDPIEPVRVRVAAALGAIGPAAVPAVPVLIEAFKDSMIVRMSAGFALEKIGREALPEIFAAYKQGRMDYSDFRIAVEGIQKALREKGFQTGVQTISSERGIKRTHFARAVA